MDKRRNEGNEGARVKEKIKKRQMNSLMRDIQAHTLIQGGELAKRLKELSIMLSQSNVNSEYVSNELQELSEKLIELAK